MDRCAWECNIWNKSTFFIPFFRCEEERIAAVFHNRWIVNIKDCSTNAVYVSIAGSCYTVIEKEPSFRSFNRSCTATDLYVLPPFASFSHYMAVFTPVFHIRALGNKDITKWSMSAVTWAGKHHEFIINLSREKDCISVKWKERIFNSCKGFEILCFCNTDCCAIEILTPDDIISIFYFYQSWIICIFRHKIISVFILERNFFFIKIPVDGILASSKIDIWNTVCLFSTEYTDELSFIWHNRTVKNTCNTF